MTLLGYIGQKLKGAVFAVSIVYLSVWEKDVVWLILGTIGVLFLVFP